MILTAKGFIILIKPYKFSAKYNLLDIIKSHNVYLIF